MNKQLKQIVFQKEKINHTLVCSAVTMEKAIELSNLAIKYF